MLSNPTTGNSWFRSASPRTAVAFFCLFALTLTSTAALDAQGTSTVQVSVKHILLPNGSRDLGLYTNNSAVQSVFQDMNTVLANNNSSFRLQLIEIKDVANTTFQSLTLSQLYTLESTAMANAGQYSWRTDAINIYIIPDLVNAGGACSYPIGHEIIAIDNNGLLNDAVGWLHEIGHYLSLTHTFSTGNLACPLVNPCDPTIGSIHATGNVACPDVCPDLNNVMSYNCIFTIGSAQLSDCQNQQMDFELYSPSGARNHVVQVCSNSLADFQCAADCVTGGVQLTWVYASGNFAYLYRGQQLLTSTPGTSYADQPGLGTHDYRLVSSGCEMTCSITLNGGSTTADNMIWRLGSPSNYDSAAALESALTSLGENTVVSNSRAPFACATPGQRLWVMAGTRPNAVEMTWEDGQFLKDAIESGVHVYVEGADVWGFDPYTPFHDVDGVDAQAFDGDNSFAAMIGSDHGLAELSDMSASYNQAAPGNDRTDRITAATESLGGSAGLIWQNDGGTSYGTGVHYATPPGIGNVICQSWEFGGYAGNAVELANRYVAALGGQGVTRAFELTGSALGINYQCGFGGPNPTPLLVNGPTFGAGANAIAHSFVIAINAAVSAGNAPQLTASLNPLDNTQFLLESPDSDFQFYVSTPSGGACEVTNNPAGCSFNPTILEVPPPVVPRFIRGDTNNDGSRNLADAIALLGYLFPGATPVQIDCLDTADANDQGSLNLADAIAILNSLFGSPPTPIAGPLLCGEDPTNDSLDCASYAHCP